MASSVMRACAGAASTTRAAQSAIICFMACPPMMATRFPAGRVLFADEDRLPLLHEGAAAFDVVLAGEAARDQGFAAAAVDLRARLGKLGDDTFHRLDGERGVVGHEGAVVAYIGLELRSRQGAVEEAHVVGFGRSEVARGEEYLLGV